MDQGEFIQRAIAVGYTREQAIFLWNCTAQKPHKHTSDEIVVDTSDGETLEDYITEMDSYEENGDGEDGGELVEAE